MNQPPLLVKAGILVFSGVLLVSFVAYKGGILQNVTGSELPEMESVVVDSPEKRAQNNWSSKNDVMFTPHVNDSPPPTQNSGQLPANGEIIMGGSKSVTVFKPDTQPLNQKQPKPKKKSNQKQEPIMQSSKSAGIIFEPTPVNPKEDEK